MPSWELFAAQDDTYRQQVLGPDGTVRVACEAASGFGWERWLGTHGTFVGMKGFGASGKAADLYRHFGITAEAIAEGARRLRNNGG
jgi:transketolase